MVDAQQLTPRINHEVTALTPFREAAVSYGISFHSGQNAANRISITQGIYYQFGDLRAELPHLTIIVEVESSGGGATNLTKYWECYETGRLTKPIKLLHIFQQKSINDYESHMVVWRFLCKKMHAALGNRFEGVCLTYRNGCPASLDQALNVFKSWLIEKPL